MKLWFLIKEGLAGFKRARLASFITVVTITLALALIGIFGLLMQNLSDEYQRLYHQIHLQVFIDPSLNDRQIFDLLSEIKALDGVEAVQYISPQEALNDFKADFGDDLIAVLGSNPLPPSFRVILHTSHSQIEAINGIVAQLETLKAVDEVVFQEKIIRLLNRYFAVGVTTALAIGATIFFIAAILIYNTIRLTIHSRQTVVEIMRLVGATNFFIKAPFVIEGVLQGLLGSLLASGMLWLAADVLKSTLLPNLNVPLLYFGILILSGALLGLLGSYISVGKYLKF